MGAIRRVCAKVLLVDSQDRVLLFSGIDRTRPEAPPTWFPVGGGAEEGETLETAAAFAGPMTIGVILTGMGNDGMIGVQKVKTAGGYVVAQDEATSIIFGMPQEAIKTGAVDQVLGIDNIFTAVEKRVMYVYGASKVGAL